MTREIPVYSRWATLGVATALTACAFASTASAAAGDLDPRFGTGGTTISDFGVDNNPFDLAVQRDGKIVVVGGASSFPENDFVVARYRRDGSLDKQFGVEGSVILDLGGYDEADGVAVQRDGKIVVVGYTADSSSGFLNHPHFAVVRFNSDGTPDLSFGDAGIVTTNFVEHGAGDSDLATDVAIQRDGKIVVGGRVSVGTSISFGLARYHTDGTLDTSFGYSGKQVTDFTPGDVDEIFAVAIQEDGKIVAAGETRNHMPNAAFALARYNLDGFLDTTFGIGGRVVTQVGAGGYARAMALQKNGKIVVTGDNFVLARYRTNGTLDPSFGEAGLVAPAFGPSGSANAIVVDEDGKIVVAGGADLNGDFVSESLAVARYLRNGSLDPNFGTGGRTTTPFFAPTYARAVGIQQGKIVVAGSVQRSDVDFVVARYKTARRH